MFSRTSAYKHKRMERKIKKFRKTIWDYYRVRGRDFPWRRPARRGGTYDPYRILVSEIMLQQTQTGRVEWYYERFLKQFPNFKVLAKAPVRDVLRAWQGLGYNRRALSLKRTAEIVVKQYGGKLPKDETLLIELLGIGPGTAGAIRAFAFNLPTVFIETNIRRVFICSFLSYKQKVSDKDIFPLIDKTLDAKNPREWYWALMDYGSTLLTTSGAGKKIVNPNRKSAHYTKQSKFEGSNRQLRGRILRLRLANPKMSVAEMAEKAGWSVDRVVGVLSALKNEGLI
ncbi:MAG: hypothetical protein A2945_04320 [Candidatus Liptonbacteria bacterium RIFCSPLOWO2_01_FULL_52_25]|uniref:HhH-GPD domain-containing protein n=1 Tax=Candidatus Liptonbacteria bacterium RIFCSPLOWO2_01_FULL_52_25 TaxID=1798650 RepID=A0A1G2CFR8_9BACT|nr:MAG: hypothetical protein A2945_04320 [Candidatus Liptonbacteria bacterium RIFCSPLOWO2_01_FULL_52_25]